MPGRGPMGGGMVGQKAMDFGPSAKRLLRRMAPERFKAVAVVVLAIGSVTLMALGPRLLGHATDLVFAGFLGRQFPDGISKDQAVAAAETRGDGQLADLLRGVDFVPGQGVDFVPSARCCFSCSRCTSRRHCSPGSRATCSTTWSRASSAGCGRTSRTRSTSCRCAYFDRQPRGELLSRVTNDIDNVSQTLQQTMSQLMTSLLTVFAVLSMMLWISPVLALIALVSVPLVDVRDRQDHEAVPEPVHRPVAAAPAGSTRTSRRPTPATSWSRSSVASEEVAETFAEQNGRLNESSFKAQFVSGLIMPVMMFIGNLNYVVIAVVGGLRVANGSLSLGEVQAFIQYTRQFTQPLTQVASMMNLLQSGVASAERVFELLDADEQSPEAAARPEPAARRGEVAFEDVSFAYDPEKPLIEDLSLVARPGQTVAIVGPTGAGKTTLVNLVMRFYELDDGRITLDGIDITEMPRSALRGQIGMVLQDTWLFEGTIRDNIAYGRPDATEAEILEAARATFVDRFVHSLPDGYDTVIDEDGGNLSAGERQLVTIARAFLVRPGAADPRRGDVVGRHPHRAAAAARDGGAALPTARRS